MLVPTRELAVQVLEVAKRLSRSCKFSSCGVVGGEDYGKQRQRLAGTVDIVVGTPGALANIFFVRFLFFGCPLSFGGTSRKGGEARFTKAFIQGVAASPTSVEDDSFPALFFCSACYFFVAGSSSSSGL